MGEGSTHQMVGSAFDITILWKMKGVCGASHAGTPPPPKLTEVGKLSESYISVAYSVPCSIFLNNL